METGTVFENILKSLPEPDVYEMPPDFIKRKMTELWPRIIIRDRFTWLAKLNVLIHRWAIVCTPFLKGEAEEEPETSLSECLRPSQNHYEQCINSLAKAIGKFRPGHVPTEEGVDAINTSRGVFCILREINPSAAITACQEAFEAFIRVWNYQGGSRMTQTEFREKLLDKADIYIRSLQPVWLGIHELEDKMRNQQHTVQLDLNTIHQDMTSGLDAVRQQLDCRHEAISQQITKSTQNVSRKIYEAKTEIIDKLPEEISPDGVKKEMVERALRQITKNNGRQTVSAICRGIIEDFKGIPGAYQTTDSLRRQLGRKKA